MMVTRQTATEKGQVLVLIVLALVVLLGMVALVLDGGAIYNARRIAQNAADASALAGAADVGERVKNETNKNWNCGYLASHNANWADGVQAAINKATTNNFTIDGDISDDNGVEIRCTGTGNDKYIDVHVRITQPVQTYLMQIVNTGNAVNTVEAVVRVKPKILYASGASLVALKDNCNNVPGPSDGGVIFDGTVNVEINDGGIISNYCCVVNGNSNAVDIDNGDWTCAGGTGQIILHPNDPLNPGNTGGLDPIPHPGAPISVEYQRLNTQLTAACGSPVTTNLMVAGSNDVTINTTPGTPKKYRNIDVNQNGTLRLGDGLYCIYGSVDIRGTLIGHDVTIFMPATAGIFLTAAGATVDLSAPPVGCDYDTPGCKPAVGGLLFLYMPDDDSTGQTDKFVLSGNSASNYEGTILVPNTAIIMSGTSELGNCAANRNRVQLVGETVIINGTGDVCINYDSAVTYEEPSFMNMQK